MIPDGTPSWAIQLFHEIRGLGAELASFSERLDGLVERIQSVECSVACLSEKTSALQLAGAHSDSCEVRISGIPSNFLADGQSLSIAVRDVLTAMGCSDAVKHVYRSRIFDPKGATSSIGTVAVQFTCTAARDDALKSGRKLKGLTSGKIFGVGGDTGIYVNPILPAPIYKLAGASRARARDLHYPPPLVNLNGVFMRSSLKGPLIPITLRSDLDHLVPNSPANPQ